MKQILLAISILGASLLTSATAQPVSALAGFNAGRIVDDSIFTNKSSMSVSDIQSFLNSKVPECDSDGSEPSEYGGGTRAQWASSRYGQTTFTCLKDYRENGNSAAQMIYNVSQQFSINPQVFLVLLQKEQGLITDEWPLNVQYRTATGYGCPDTAPCDTQYFGLGNQLTWSGKMFRAILNNSPNWYTPYVLGNNYIQYSPTASCGGSVVNILNRSTQALYNYTPYQPNQAALDAGYGTAPCGAYGNRNFFLYFRDWFGSPVGSGYWLEPYQQFSHTDSSMNTTIDTTNMSPTSADRVYLTVRVKNTGIATWRKWSVNLGTSQPQNRTSAIYDSTWLSANRAATLTEDSVAPGAYGTFSFWAKRPQQAGSYKEYFNVVAEGVTWLNDMGIFFHFNVQPSVYTWDVESQLAYTDATKTTQANLANMVTGEQAYMSVRVKNTGNTAWYKDRVNLATTSPKDRASSLQTPTWLSDNRAATIQEDVVMPGQTGTIEFWVSPQKTGTYQERFNLVDEGKGWMRDIGFYYPFSVQKAQYSWEPVSQLSYTDQTKSQALDTANMVPDQTGFMEIRVRNTGNTTWKKWNLNLATNGPRDRSSNFHHSSWLSNNRVATMVEDSVAPNGIATFRFTVKAPTTKGTSREYFNFVSEGNTWLNDLGLYYQYTVK